MHHLDFRLTGINPSSEAYHNLMKDSAALLPLVEGYQQLQQFEAEVRGGGAVNRGSGQP